MIGRGFQSVYFNGTIDDVRIYNRALTQSEVAKLYYLETNITHDSAGNLTKDAKGYEYEYDYENRLAKITKDGNDIAEFTYDALGRRIQKKDVVGLINNNSNYC